MEQFLQQGFMFLEKYPWLIAILAIWVLPWKGIALWKAAKLGQKKWFVALLIVNTLAILEIIYIFIVARKKEKSETIQYNKVE